MNPPAANLAAIVATTPDAPAASQSVVRQPRWRRRLLIALLLVLALAGGLWWNSTRLNATERRLVGVWNFDADEKKDSQHWFLLADRRFFLVMKVDDDWRYGSKPYGTWEASPVALTISTPVPLPRSLSFQDWRDYVEPKWNGWNRAPVALDRFANERVDFDIDRKTAILRSTDPELLRLFDRLSAGESP